MSNNKLDATFGRGPTAVVHLHTLYDVVCHECGWEYPNPISDRRDAQWAADVHRCGVA